MGPFVASTLTRTLPVVATNTLLAPLSPRARPGCSETTPATRVSYACVEGMTWLDLVESRTTTVPLEICSEEGTHSATSWYLALIVPVRLIFPVPGPVPTLMLPVTFVLPLTSSL